MFDRNKEEGGGKQLQFIFANEGMSGSYVTDRKDVLTIDRRKDGEIREEIMIIPSSFFLF